MDIGPLVPNPVMNFRHFSQRAYLALAPMLSSGLMLTQEALFVRSQKHVAIMKLYRLQTGPFTHQSVALSARRAPTHLTKIMIPHGLDPVFPLTNSTVTQATPALQNMAPIKHP